MNELSRIGFPDEEAPAASTYYRSSAIQQPHWTLFCVSRGRERMARAQRLLDARNILAEMLSLIDASDDGQRDSYALLTTPGRETGNDK